ncbi:MAG: hypothetical protein QM496_04335 [Verrucomicrobiota bacterium]
MAIQKDWKISRRHSKCTHSGEKFADGQSFYTCIFDDPENEGFLRKDFSEAAWEELSDTLEPFSFWKTTCKYPKEDTSPEVLGNESAETMLRRMIEEDEAGTENARYILTLMLERKKALIPVGVKETESSRLLLYEHRASGDVLVVRDPQLKLDEVEAVQQEVSLLLDQNNTQQENNHSDSEVGEQDAAAADSETTGDQATDDDLAESDTEEIEVEVEAENEEITSS